jgi:hypothetical protein
VRLLPFAVVEAKKQKCLDDLVRKGKIDLKKSRSLSTNITNPKVSAILDKYDANGDVDISLLDAVIVELNEKRKQNVNLKRTAVGVFLIVIILLMCNSYLTYWIVNLSKDTSIRNNDNTIVNVKTGEIVITDKPRLYTLLTDIPKLPMKALNSLQQVTFVTSDAGFHRYQVQGLLNCIY